MDRISGQDDMQAMGEARLMMAEHCQGRFDVLETEGELHYRCRDTDELHTAVASR